MIPEEAVVVPLVPLNAEVSTETLLRMLLDREALVISRVSGSASQAPSGMIAQTSGAFARAIGEAVSQMGCLASNDGLCRVIRDVHLAGRKTIALVSSECPRHPRAN